MKKSKISDGQILATLKDAEVLADLSTSNNRR